MAVYGFVGLFRAMNGYGKPCKAMQGYVRPRMAM